MRWWWRIGVVLSVIWFVGFGGWLWLSSTGAYMDIHQWQLQDCFNLYRKEREQLQGFERWSRLSEQIFRIDKWSLCQG
jgi:hypothetical protein